MRTLLIIVMILAFLVATGMGLMIAEKNLFSEDAQAVVKLIEVLGDSEEAKQLGGFRTSGWGGLFVGLLTLVMVIVTFVKNTKVIQIVAGATVALSVLFILLSPGFETGPLAGANPKQQAMVYGIAAIIAAVCGFLAEKARLKKAGA